MDQAPPAISQTVNRVIEHTVEKVVPTGQSAATVVTQEKTVIVKETELISQAVEKASQSIVRIYDPEKENPDLLGMGIVIDAQGGIVTDAAALGDYGSAVVSLPDGTKVRAFVTERDAKTSFAFLRATTSKDTPSIVWKPAAISSGNVVLGQTVVALAGKSVTRIASGIVTAIPGEHIIDTDIADASILHGSPLINTSGDVIGMRTGVSRAASASGFVFASLLIAPPKNEDKKSE